MSPGRLLRRAGQVRVIVADTGRRLRAGEFRVRDLVWLARWKWATLRLPKTVQLFADACDDSLLLQIGDARFCWHAEYCQTQLDMVWAEVFSPFPPNGHAYEHLGCVIQPGDWVIDAGACEGFFVRYALARGANVLAVEPVPRLAECLRKTFSEGALRGRVTVVNALLGSSTGSAFISLTAASPISARSTPLRGEPVPVTTVDELLSTGMVPRVDFIKMDIEGSEPDAMLGARRTLASLRPRVAVCVYHAHDHERQIQTFLEEVGVGYETRAKGLTRNGPTLVRQVLHAWGAGRVARDAQCPAPSSAHSGR